jgi:hypothetical protein
MANVNPPKRAQAFSFDVSLEDYVNPGQFKGTPTLAAGDFKVSKDNGALANLTTLPTNTPASSKMVQIDLSATEMTADKVTVICSDQTAPPEWADLVVTINTTA